MVLFGTFFCKCPHLTKEIFFNPCAWLNMTQFSWSVLLEFTADEIIPIGLVNGHKGRQWRVGFWRVRKGKTNAAKGGDEKEKTHEGMTGWGAHLVVCWESRHGSSPAMAFHRQKVLSVREPVPPHLSHLYCLLKQRETMRDCPGTAGKSRVPGALETDRSTVNGRRTSPPSSLSLHTVRRWMSRRTVLPKPQASYF